jgi:putative cardiolipin synthase
MIIYLLKLLGTAVVVATVLIVVARFLFPLPSLADRTVSRALPPTAQTTLGRALSPQMAAHPGLSGVVPLKSGLDAFASRYLLADRAEESIDARYYIWQNDASGILLLDALRQAALRGVRVRLLLDDNGIAGLDPLLAAFDALDSAEVRLFNPFTFRHPKFASYLFDFPRLNRRMHNKSFTVDGAVTIVGGRNIGDIYFERGNEAHYFDLDVLAVGKAAADVAEDFDAYWASASSYPIALFVPPPEDGLVLLDRARDNAEAQPDAPAYREAIATSKFVRDLTDRTLEPEWVTATLVSDDPAKGLGRLKNRDGLLINQLAGILDTAERSIDLISAYFVPGDRLIEHLTEAAGNGVSVRAMTNSLEATDVMLVHAGYAGSRAPLLAAGVELFELRSGREERTRLDDFGILGSSTTSLHAKTLIVDRERIFIGSFNFDPRSAFLNCEMGFLIESPALSDLMSTQIDSNADVGAYAVELDAQGRLQWIETAPDGTQTRHTTEPRTTAPARFLVRVVGWLPIKWML